MADPSPETRSPENHTNIRRRLLRATGAAALAASLLAGCGADSGSVGSPSASAKNTSTAPNTNPAQPTDPRQSDSYPNCPAGSIDVALPNFRIAYDMNTQRMHDMPAIVSGIAAGVMQSLQFAIQQAPAASQAKMITFDGGFVRLSDNRHNGDFMAEYVTQGTAVAPSGCIVNHLAINHTADPANFTVDVFGYADSKLALITTPKYAVTMADGSSLTTIAAADLTAVASCATGWVNHPSYETVNRC